MNRRLFLLLLPALILFSSCSKHGYVRLNFPKPPRVVLPDHVKTVAVINRTIAPEDDQQRKKESILSAEILGSDKLASDECLKGIMAAGQNLNQIQFTIANPSRYEGTGTRETPELMDWGMVGQICEDNQVDALLVLEIFDSNSDLLATTAVNQVGSVLSGNVPKGINVPRNTRVSIKSYWRMYDPYNQQIIDQFTNNDYMTVETLSGAMGSPALTQTAYQSGEKYISRLAPSFYSVRREMYRKGSGKSKRQFENGFRRSEMANWQEAIDAWEPLVNTGNRKTAGRACLNIAVAYEVLGDTNQALQWAQRSYQDFDDDLGRDYAKILLRRRDLEP